MQSAPVVRFGTFELDVRAGELRKHSLKIKLQDQPFQILVMLLEQPGQVVTREQLHQKLWAEGTFVDFEHGLNAAIQRLRQALGDTAENPRFVETIARRGYRFLAPVDCTVNGAAETTSQAVIIPGPVVERRRLLELLRSMLLAFVSIGLLALCFAYFRRKPQEARPVRFSISPPEGVAFADLDAAGPALISPDGSRLAFVGVGEGGNSQLWVRPLDALAAQPLAGTANPTYPFWSPDGRYLAFFADGKLKKVSARGGPPEILCNAPNGRGGSWGGAQDRGPGDIVFAPDRYMGLSRVSAAGGKPVQVTALDALRQEASHRLPEFLPDGRHFLYVAFGNRAESNGIFVGDIQAKPDPKNLRRLMNGDAHVSYASPGYLLFPRDSNLVAQPFDARRLEFSGEPIVIADHVGGSALSRTSDFSVSANGVLAWRTRSGASRQLAWFDRRGKQIEGLDAREPYLYPNLSPDGNRVAVNKLDAAQPIVWSIWLLDLVRGSASRFTFGRWWANPIWSPDARQIVFGLGSPPDYGVYWKDTSGAGNEELLLKADRYLFPTDWSRDGRFLLFDQENDKTKWDIWVLPFAGDRKPALVVQTEFNERYGQFSPDGRWIAYVSDESGRYEVYVRSFAQGGAGVTAGKLPVSTAGGFLPRWRRDGKELFFAAPDGKLMAVPVKLGSTFEAGVPVTLFDTYESGIGSSDVDYFSYAVRADGQRFLISRTLEGGASRPVNICLNWLAGVKK